MINQTQVEQISQIFKHAKIDFFTSNFSSDSITEFLFDDKAFKKTFIWKSYKLNKILLYQTKVTIHFLNTLNDDIISVSFYDYDVFFEVLIDLVTLFSSSNDFEENSLDFYQKYNEFFS